MIRFFSTAFLLMSIMTACASPAVPTLPPSPLPPTPSVTVAPPSLLPPLKPDVLLLTPNQSYYVVITFANSPPATVTIQSSDQKASFVLNAQADISETPVFDSPEQTSGTWGMPYILYALNRQPGRNTPSSRSTEGAIILSENRRVFAYSLCNEYGGRGQWCSDANLWLFDIATGEARQADFADSDLLYISNLHFSDDSQTLIGESCLKYVNPYFGYCGATVVMTWDVTTGDLLNLSTLPTAVPWY